MKKYQKKDMEEAIKEIKIWKSAEEDDIASEFIMETSILDICRQASKVQIQNDWEKIIIVLIHKKGTMNNCNNYRAVCLAPVIMKLCSRIIEKRLRKEIEVQWSAFRSP